MLRNLQRPIASHLTKTAVRATASVTTKTSRTIMTRTAPCVNTKVAAVKAKRNTPVFVSTRSFSSALDSANVDTKLLRNVGIIAHVDHGKTTMVDSMLQTAGTRMNEGEVRLMDSNTLERERGITILAKCTSVIYSDTRTSQDYQINIVDTPGHADFGAEVERIISMLDGVCLIVDATEGPMAQTKFVLKKALAQGLRPIVVINKVDRPSARLGEVENEIFDLFVNLDATDEQLEYPVIYASGRAGWASNSADEIGTAMDPLFQGIIDHINPPVVDLDAPFRMLVTQIESDNFFGKCLIGRITDGTCKPGDPVHALDEQGNIIETTKVLKILRRRGMNRFVVDQAHAGDIISLAGFSTASVNATLCHPSIKEIIPSIPIDPPTLSMTFQVNDSPLCGREGTAHTSNSLRTRLTKEAENNVSIRVIDNPQNKEVIEVRARGELQLGVIIETIRREGYELAVSPPQVVFDFDPVANKLLEPVEEIMIDVEDHMSGNVIEKLSKRGGEMKEFNTMNDGRVRLLFHIPTRGFLGFRSEFTNDTRGQGVLTSIFHEYIEYKGDIERNEKGALLTMEDGICSAYALEMAEARGVLFVEPGTVVYKGMVIGENSRSDDLELNPVKSKVLTNIRTVMKDEKTRLSPPRRISLEEMISYVRDDEIIEITPKSIRLRKKILDSTARKTASKSQKSIALKGVAADPRFMQSMNMK